MISIRLDRYCRLPKLTMMLMAMTAGMIPPALVWASDAACQRPPQIAAWTADAGPDESLFLTASSLPSQVELAVRPLAGGSAMRFPARWSDEGHVLAVLPARAPKGPLLVAVGHEDCWSAPITLNAAQAWWSYPAHPAPDQRLRIFGRDLNFRGLRVSLQDNSGASHPLKVTARSDYWLEVALPADLRADSYRLTLDGGADSKRYGASLDVRVTAPAKSGRTIEVDSVAALRQALQDLTSTGGLIHLHEGRYVLDAPLAIPGGVTLQGAGIDRTVLVFNGAVASTAGLVKPGAPYEKSAELPEPVPGKSGQPAVAGVLMFESRAGLANLSIDGGGVIEQGMAIAGIKAAPIEGIRLVSIEIKNLAAFHGPHGQTEAVLARHVRELEVRNSRLLGSGPALFLEDVADSAFIDNTLAGGGEGVITGREGGVRRTLIERNHLLSKEDGAVQAVRAIWLSTLFGSTFDNYIAGNHGADFHPPAGTEQNRGEAILLETALNHPYFGHPTASGRDSLTLPQQGPDWASLEANPELRRTRLEDYFVVVLGGPGQGQARRILKRLDDRLLLDQPWRVQPTVASTILITELFWHNLIIGNEIRDAMTGVQFWLNGVENVIADNHLSELLREGILLHGTAVGGPQERPPFWPIEGHNQAGFNRGIGVVYFNSIIGNQVTKANLGINVSGGNPQSAQVPLAWPTSMGNVIRRNLIADTKRQGIWTGIRGGPPMPFDKIPGYVLIGNLIEHNEVDVADDAVPLLGGDDRGEALVFRHNKGHLQDIGDAAKRLLAKPSQAAGWVVEDNQPLPVPADSDAKPLDKGGAP